MTIPPMYKTMKMRELPRWIDAGFSSRRQSEDRCESAVRLEMRGDAHFQALFNSKTYRVKLIDT